MISSDIFGFSVNDLDLVRNVLETCLRIQFVPRESSFRGEYYLYEGPDGEELLLEMNVDPEDGEPFYSEFSDYPVILLVDATTRSKQLAELLLDKIEGCKLLRHKDIE